MNRLVNTNILLKVQKDYVLSLEKWAQRTNVVIAMFESWLVRHGKSYNALGEKQTRFEIFKENLRFVNEHNTDMNRSYRVGLNQFSDLSNEDSRSTSPCVWGLR